MVTPTVTQTEVQISPVAKDKKSTTVVAQDTTKVGDTTTFADKVAGISQKVAAGKVTTSSLNSNFIPPQESTRWVKKVQESKVGLGNPLKHKAQSIEEAHPSEHIRPSNVSILGPLPLLLTGPFDQVNKDKISTAPLPKVKTNMKWKNDARLASSSSPTENSSTVSTEYVVPFNGVASLQQSPSKC